MRNSFRLFLARRRGHRAQLRIGANCVTLRTKNEELEHRQLVEPGFGPACLTAEACIATHPELSIDARLSCAWTRVMILPALPQLTSEERWRNYARARFEQIYAAGSDSWDMRLGRSWPGADRVAVAWPTSLRAQLIGHRNVQSVRVTLLEDLEVLLSQMPTFSGCLAQIEECGAGLMLVRRGRLRRARWCRFEDAEGLAASMAAEWASVCVLEPIVAGDAALALSHSPIKDEITQSRTIHLLSAGLGASRAFALPDRA